MRGKVPTRSCQALARGITPAYAGKSIQRGRPDHASRDHPRVCGEKHLCSGRPLSLWGSPPRMRGKAEPGFVLWVTSGITPAYAGKRELNSLTSWQWRDHPRVCGEKLSVDVCIVHQVGSPPRMRGKVGWSAERSGPEGITPAYAGKRGRCPNPSQLLRDHPRVCGEKSLSLWNSPLSSGSPPRMRGKDYEKDLKTKERGITPAYAGKSCPAHFGVVCWWDHPRVCGEKTKKIPSHRPFQLHPVPVSFSFA